MYTEYTDSFKSYNLGRLLGEQLTAFPISILGKDDNLRINFGLIILHFKCEVICVVFGKWLSFHWEELQKYAYFFNSLIL